MKIPLFRGFIDVFDIVLREFVNPNEILFMNNQVKENYTYIYIKNVAVISRYTFWECIR